MNIRFDCYPRQTSASALLHLVREEYDIHYDQNLNENEEPFLDEDEQ